MSISRRQFLVGAGVAALGVSVFSLTGCNSKANEGIQVIYGSIFTGVDSTLAEAM